MSEHLHETCGCGATFDWTGTATATMSREVTKWRESHRCSTPVAPGPCGHASSLVGGTKAICQLRAGHAGWHESDGASWGLARYTTEADR